MFLVISHSELTRLIPFGYDIELVSEQTNLLKKFPQIPHLSGFNIKQYQFSIKM